MTSIRPLAQGFPDQLEETWRASARRAGSCAAEGGEAAGNLPELPPRGRGARPIVPGSPGTTWTIVERIGSGRAAEVSGVAGAALSAGASGIELIFAGAIDPAAARIEAPPAEVAAALSRVAVAPLLVRVSAGPPREPAFRPFADLAASTGSALSWAFDPAARAAVGTIEPIDGDCLRAAAAMLDQRGVAGEVLVADGRLWHAGGATEEQEIGITIATFAHHIRVLGAPERIGIALAADSDQFRTIAKFRAMRLLVARVVEVAGLPPFPLRIHAETAWRSLSKRETENNIMRTTTAAFAAVLGGADSITVLPFDTAAMPGSGAKARRLARNLQVILAEESHLGRVADPAAGSDAIEHLTAGFAEAGWRRFQAIEAEGGIMGAIADGALLRDVAEAREARLTRVARGDIRLIGVNAFREGSKTATVRRPPVKRTGPLTFKLLSEPFEDDP